MSISGHLWTIWPLVRDRLQPPPAAPDGELWQIVFEDPAVGRVALTGRLATGRSSSLVVLVHGLGGSSASSYVVRAARVADSLGMASLRLDLRGAGHGGRDFYHGGLSSDLGRALASPELEGFESVYLLGFSLGGHLCLRFATEVHDPRVRAVAAVSSPLDLEVSVRHFDRPAGYLYRCYILRGLFDMAARQNGRSTLPATLDELRRVRRLRDWDRLTVVPRFGFENTSDYYRRASVGHRLDRLRRPALLVATEGDPLVAARAVRSPLERYAGGDLRRTFEVRWVPGGHVSFPAGLDLGQDGPAGIHGQVMSWLRSAGRSSGEGAGPLRGRSTAGRRDPKEQSLTAD